MFYSAALVVACFFILSLKQTFPGLALAAAADRGVGLHGMSTHRSNGAHIPPLLVMDVGNVPERTIPGAVTLIADLPTLTSRRPNLVKGIRVTDDLTSSLVAPSG